MNQKHFNKFLFAQAGFPLADGHGGGGGVDGRNMELFLWLPLWHRKSHLPEGGVAVREHNQSKFSSLKKSLTFSDLGDILIKICIYWCSLFSDVLPRVHSHFSQGQLLVRLLGALGKGEGRGKKGKRDKGRKNKQQEKRSIYDEKASRFVFDDLPGKRDMISFNEPNIVAVVLGALYFSVPYLKAILEMVCMVLACFALVKYLRKDRNPPA